MSEPMRCEIRGPHCTGEALQIHDLPESMCDACFAWMGMARTRPVTFWEHLRDALGLFAKIVWRPFEGERIGAWLAWNVAWDASGGSRLRQYPEGQ